MSSVQCLPALERYATQSTSDSSDSTWYQKETPKRRTLYLCKRCLPHRNREHASHNSRAPIRNSIHTERVYNSNYQVGNHGGSSCRHQFPTVSLTEQDLDVSMDTCRDPTRRLGTRFKGLLGSEDDSPWPPAEGANLVVTCWNSHRLSCFSRIFVWTDRLEPARGILSRSFESYQSGWISTTCVTQ